MTSSALLIFSSYDLSRADAYGKTSDLLSSILIYGLPPPQIWIRSCGVPCPVSERRSEAILEMKDSIGYSAKWQGSADLPRWSFCDLIACSSGKWKVAEKGVS